MPDTLALLRRARTEMADWADALSGERPSLDALCAEIDTALAPPAKRGWRVEFRYNGRLDGRTERTIIVGEHSVLENVIAEMQRDAVRVNGAIFVRGYSVDWVEPALEPDAEGEEG